MPVLAADVFKVCECRIVGGLFGPIPKWPTNFWHVQNGPQPWLKWPRPKTADS